MFDWLIGLAQTNDLDGRRSSGNHQYVLAQAEIVKEIELGQVDALAGVEDILSLAGHAMEEVAD